MSRGYEYQRATRFVILVPVTTQSILVMLAKASIQSKYCHFESRQGEKSYEPVIRNIF